MRTMIISKFKNCRMIFKKILLVEEVEEGRVEVEEGMMEVEKDRVEVEEKREEGMEMEVRNEGEEGIKFVRKFGNSGVPQGNKGNVIS